MSSESKVSSPEVYPQWLQDSLDKWPWEQRWLRAVEALSLRGDVKPMVEVYLLGNAEQRERVNARVAQQAEGDTFTFKWAYGSKRLEMDVTLNGDVEMMMLDTVDAKGILACLQAADPEKHGNYSSKGGFTRDTGTYWNKQKGEWELFLSSPEENQDPIRFIGKSLENFQRALEAFLAQP